MSHKATCNCYADFTSIKSILSGVQRRGYGSSQMSWAPSLTSISAVGLLPFFLIFISRTSNSILNLKSHFLRLLCSSRKGILLCDFVLIGLNKACICMLQ